MSTTRSTRGLLGAEGTALATVYDDLVTATVPGGTPVPLRQVEVVDGDQVLLDQIHRALTEVGMQRSSWASRLQRALRDVDPAGQRLDPEPALSKETAGATLHRYLVGQRRALTRADLAVRTMSASVHDVRVAARRLRAALTVYRRLLDADRARHLQGELQWIGRELSDLRDAEVAGEALFAALEDEPDLGAADSARGLVQRELTATEGRASAAAETALASGRYLALLTQLDMLCAAPPWTDQASESADTALPKVLAKPHRRLRRAAKAAAAAGPDERTSSLHEVRKCAKRLRYSLEVAEPALGDPAHRLANTAKHVQSHLGDHLDAVALGEWLLRLGHDPDARAAAFTLGRLHARNEERIPLPLDDYRRAVKQVLRKKNSAFLRTA
jgi:CHAD domain-containing protein